MQALTNCNKYIYSINGLNDYLVSATTSNQYPDGLNGSFYMKPTSNSMGNQTTAKASLLSFASHLNFDVHEELNGSAGLINVIKNMQANGEHVFVNFYYIDKGMVQSQGKYSISNDPIIIIGTNDVIDLDTQTISNNASTPMANTGFVDSIRRAQAGQGTPDLNASAVKQAKQALEDAKAQLANDQQALIKLQNGTADPAAQAETNHNNKLASLKTAYDQAIKHANDIYNQAIAQAKKTLNDANAKADKTYNDTLTALKKTHDDKINSINQAYTKAVNDATTARDLKLKEANGDPSYLTDLKTQLQNKLNDQIKADQAKIDAIKHERDTKLAELKKANDVKTNDAIQAILAKYGVSDAQVQAKIAPLLADIKANKTKLAQLEHEDAVAKEAAISHNTTNDAISGIRNGSNGHYAYTSNGTTITLPSDDNVTNNATNSSYTPAASNNEALPQTGNTGSRTSVLGLLLLAAASTFGFGMKKRKEY